MANPVQTKLPFTASSLLSGLSLYLRLVRVAMININFELERSIRINYISDVQSHFNSWREQTREILETDDDGNVTSFMYHCDLHWCIPFYWVNLKSDELSLLMFLVNSSCCHKEGTVGDVIAQSGVETYEKFNRILWRLCELKILIFYSELCRPYLGLPPSALNIEREYLCIDIFEQMRWWEEHYRQRFGSVIPKTAGSLYLGTGVEEVKTSCVYFFQGQNTKLIKIGQSVDPENRRGQVQTDAKEPVEILLSLIQIPGSITESVLHQVFAPYNTKHPEYSSREWFEPCTALTDYIEHLRQYRQRFAPSLDSFVQEKAGFSTEDESSSDA